MLEAELVHSGLATLVAFAVTDQQRPAGGVDVGLVQRQRFADPQPGAPEDRDQRPQAQAVAVMTGLAHDHDDLLRARRVRRVLHPLVMRRPSGEISRGRRRRPSTTRRIDKTIELEDMTSSLRIGVPANPGRTATNPQVIARPLPNAPS